MTHLQQSGLVLDASALVAYLHAEPGGGRVARAKAAGASISSVNLAEACTRVMRDGGTVDALIARLAGRGLAVEAFDESDARTAAELFPQTRHLGLSLGDRACLARVAS